MKRVLLLAAVLSGAALAAPLKVGLVTDIGGLNDHGFNQLAYQGLLRAEKTLGITGSVVQSQAQSDYVPNLSNFARNGYNLVIAVGYLMQDAVERVSKEFPNTKFLIIDSAITNRKNVTSAIFSTQECGYLVGALAGLVEKDKALKLPGLAHNNIIGVVGGISIPPVNTYIAGYYQGAMATDPNIKILRGYTGNFNDPAAGKQLTLAQHSQGADIVFMDAGGTGLGGIQAAKQGNFYAIGVDTDQAYLAPHHVLTSAVKGVNTSVYDTIAALTKGKFRPGISTFDLQNHGVGIGTILSSVPAKFKAEIAKLAAEIASGKIKVSPNIPKTN
jgi:basic membrane protein A